MGLVDELTPDELGLLDKMETDLFKVGPKETPPGPLHHYTTPEALWAIVRSREIWATHFRYLNDTKELVHGEEIAIDVAKDLLSKPHDAVVKAFINVFVENFPKMRFTEMGGVFVASFSENEDQLSQWRAYGGSGSGYSIGLSRFPTPTAENPDAKAGLGLHKCTYDAETFRAFTRDLLLEMAKGFDKYVTAHAKREPAARGMLATAMGICWRRLVAETLRLKADGFHEEAEWRLIVVAPPDGGRDLVKFRPSSRGMVPYVSVALVDPETDAKLPISSITVGPGDNASLAHDAARMFLSLEGYESAGLLRPSKIPYRTSR